MFLGGLGAALALMHTHPTGEAALALMHTHSHGRLPWLSCTLTPTGGCLGSHACTPMGGCLGSPRPTRTRPLPLGRLARADLA